MKTTRLNFKTLLPLTTVAIALGAVASAAPVFEQFDRNSDGQIEKSEFEAARDDRFARADTNGDGFLSAEEIEARAENRMQARISAMVEQRDTNADGKLSRDEMQSGPRAERRFEKMDRNGDGTIDKAEFAAMAERMQKRRAALR